MEMRTCGGTSLARRETSLASSGAVPERCLRVIHVDTGRHWRGSQHQIAYSLQGQLHRGHDAKLICPPRVPLAEHAGKLAVDVIPIPITCELNPLAVLKVALQLRSLRPDIVHLHSSHAHTIGGIAARLARVPAVILSRRLDNPIEGRIRRWKYRRFYDAVIAVSHGVRQVLVEAGVAPELIFTVHSAVPACSSETAGGRDRIRREFHLDSARRVITAVAHIEPRKGIESLIEAMPIVLRECPSTVLFVVGGGSHRGAVEQKAFAVGLRKEVLFTGFRADVQDFLAASDVVVSPSYLEGCSNALLEAMVLGRPVVGTKVGGTPEIIEHWVNGLLVPPKDPEALAWALVRILSDQELASDMGDAGRRTIEEKFTVDRMVGETLQVYRHVLYGAEIAGHGSTAC